MIFMGHRIISRCEGRDGIDLDLDLKGEVGKSTDGRSEYRHVTVRHDGVVVAGFHLPVDSAAADVIEGIGVVRDAIVHGYRLAKSERGAR